MKNIFYLLLCALFLTSCGSSKSVNEISRKQATSLEGEKVTVETMKMQGIEMAESLNDEGTEIIERPFKWYAGVGKADNKQVAIELA